VTSNDGIAEDAHARYVHFNSTPWLQRADTRRSTCCDQIARFQRHELRDIGDYNIDGKYHIRYRRILTHVSIDARAHPQTAKIHFRARYDPRTCRAEGIETFAARPLPILLLEIAGCDIVDSRIAVNRIPSFLRGDPASPPTDDDAEFGLMIDTLRNSRIDDRVACADQRRGRFQKNQGLCRHLIA
jgi:hypothetical protein